MAQPPVRARDLRASIRELGFELGIVNTLEHLLDEYAEHRQHMRELTELVSTCVDEIAKFVHIGVEIRDQLAQMKRDREVGESINGKPT